MPRYVAFLRGVSPMNAKMPQLKRAFEAAGFTDVKTVLSSGNVAFSAHTQSETALVRQAETAMDKHLGHTFYTIVRSSKALHDLIEVDPFATFDLPANAKRVVTFLGKPHKVNLSLPIDRQEVFTAYVPSPRGAVFMRLIEKTFGNEVTTRTWETVKKCSIA